MAVPLGPWVEFRRKRSVPIAMDLVRFTALLTIPAAFSLGVLTFLQLLLVEVVVAGDAAGSKGPRPSNSASTSPPPTTSPPWPPTSSPEAFRPGGSDRSRSKTMDDCGVLVEIEAVRQASVPSEMVRVRSDVGTAVVLWQGDPGDVGREHHVEWTVDDYMTWAGNTKPAASASSAVAEEGDQIILRGRLSLPGDKAAFLEIAGSQILFDLADPLPPDEADGTWVEVRLRPDSVSLWPHQI
ncbi:hypothetical protein J2Z21_007245 [Streptomyces griseochromogenes]|uniref:Uncharacterized protein n=2 Tax=Streptomyces griseochromogenes TaxID=68214 RepID=A0ABS4M478_9ACTN|nr:hypothetical protein [Streptomyces griseochromogenes]